MAYHHLVLDTNQVQQVLNILGTRPFNEVAPLIQKIAAQLQPAAPPPGNGAEQVVGPHTDRAPNG